MSKRLVVAIDGPAGSGKSTSAKLVAQKLGFLYIDTGAMYRAVTLLAIKKNVLNNIEAITGIANSADIQLEYSGGKTRVFVDGAEATDEIRTPEVNMHVSDISKIPDVRTAMVRKQQQMGNNNGGVVMEGRDIGTVVFPDADVKIFLTASIDQRTIRRTKEFTEKGVSISVEEVKKNLVERDEIDSTREASPLKKAHDAVEVDTSFVSIDEQVNIILNKIKESAIKKGIEINY